MEKQLDLDEFETLAFEEDEQGRYHFTVRAVRYAPYCPHCGSTSTTYTAIPAAPSATAG